jgi:hypothetical protein
MSKKQYRLVRAIAKFRRATVNFVMPVCPSVRLSVRQHGTTSQFPNRWIFIKFYSEYFSKIFREYSSLIKIAQ